MTFDIEYEAEKQLEFDYEKLIHSVILAALDAESCPYEAEVNIILTDNEKIGEINKEYRQIDRPTDVLSFPLIEYEVPGAFDGLEENAESCFNLETGELMLGDIIVSVDKVYEQAQSYGHSLERELGFLIAHSMFHLMGYDHMEEDERKEMEKKQSDLLEELNILR